MARAYRARVPTTFSEQQKARTVEDLMAKGHDKAEAHALATKQAMEQGFAESWSGEACIFRLDGDDSDRKFTETDLDTVVANFAARKAGTQSDVPAPWHLGHEEDRAIESRLLANRTDLPAIAKTEAVFRKGLELWAKVSGPGATRPILDLYPYRSAELYRDYPGQGPTLKGVGLLGASQPAKKGLGAVVLNDATGGEYVITAPVLDTVRFQEAPMATPIVTPAPAPANVLTVNDKPVVTVEQFAELSAKHAAATAILEGQKAILAQQAADLATLKAEREGAKVERFVEERLVLSGRVGPEVAAKVKTYLRQVQVIEKFAENVTPFEAACALLDAVLPKPTARTALVSGGHKAERPATENRLGLVVEKYTDLRARGGLAPFETFAEACALSPEETTKALALLPESLRPQKNGTAH